MHPRLRASSIRPATSRWLPRRGMKTRRGGPSARSSPTRLHDRGADGLWPAHPQDEPGNPDDRLHDVVQGNLRHPAREALWGSPGTLLAAAHMADATGDPRWAALLEAGARILLEEMVFDERIAAWSWQQDLYGRTSCHLGAAHGFAGNVYTALRAAKWVPPELVAEFADRALQTLQALALRADGCANWHPMHPPRR